jgi:adenine-specific DNA-methyltransferase
MPRKKTRVRAKKGKPAQPYRHPEAESPMRPEVGTQAQFKKKLPPKTYRYDSSLSPALDWDGQNPAREQGEALIREILEAQELEGVKAAASKLKALSKPFLNWAGKAERLSFDVPTLPLFIHERLSTKAILETLKGHKRDKQQTMFDLFGDPQHSITDQVLRAYEHRDKWVNRMILGDSLVVMNSLLHYEGLGGQVQMIYIDPPYGVKFGSNFQPFVRRREVKHNEDNHMTREPEMVQAYRDTWELGVHSYLTYLRDRLLIGRDLLHPSGSLFVQMNDENLHHVRELMDEVFGRENFVTIVSFATTTGFESTALPRAGDYLLWYARDKGRIKFHTLYVPAERQLGEVGYRLVRLPDGASRGLTAAEIRGDESFPEGAKLYKPDNIISQGSSSEPQPFTYEGKTYEPPANAHWKAHYPTGMNRLAEANRLHVSQNTLQYIRFADDFPWWDLNNVWTDTVTGQFTEPKTYAVQTNTKVVSRCILMTTDPGDLVLDPTCGGGTAAYCAELWGRRWLTIDCSRVPLALARQRLLTATFSWYGLKDESRGPAGGFDYKRKQNSKGEEVGGIVPHITLKSIATDEPPQEEILVDRPEIDKQIIRVTGPLTVEATIPTPVDWEADGIEDSGVPPEEHASFVERMLEVLRRSPLLRLEGNKTVTLKNIRPPAKSLSLSAEALVEATAYGQKPTLAEAVQEAKEKGGAALPLSQKPVALVFGPENGAVSEKLVYEAAREAHAKDYSHLYVIGFAIQPHARELIEKCTEVVGVPATYVQATPDLMMGDLLKNMRSSQIFSVCGLPEVEVRKVKQKSKTNGQLHEVELLGLDVFDPVSMETKHRTGDDVPAWFLDTDYNGLCFHVSQAFFPRTGAWESLKKALKAEYEESVWEHLAGAVSAPFEGGEHKQIAVKVIDDRGNELLVVKPLSEAN